jgi:integrase
MPEYRIVSHRGKLSLAYNDDERGRVRIALGTDDRGLAEARAREIWGKRTSPVSDRVSDLWASYIANRKLEGVPTTRLEDAWKALGPHFGHKIGSAVNAQDCKEYAKARKRLGRSDSTIRTELEYLRAALNKRYGRGSVDVWTPPASAPRSRYLTKEEANQLLDSITTPHVRLFVLLAIATGARMSALLELTWDRVDFARRTVDLQPAGRHKTNKGRAVVPVNQRAWEALLEAHKARLTDYVIEHAEKPVASIKKAIRAAATRSGVPCSPHVFRHTAAVWMAEAGRSMDEIAQFLGHTNTKLTTRVYARYSPDFLRGASAATEF